jgi:hypothetical protein
MSLKKPSGESQDQTTSSTKGKDGEIKIDHPHPTKQQKETNTKRPGFFMDNVTTGSTVTYACEPLQPEKEPCSLNAIQQISVNTPSISTLVNNPNHFPNDILKDHSNSSKFIIYHQNI